MRVLFLLFLMLLPTAAHSDRDTTAMVTSLLKIAEIKYGISSGVLVAMSKVESNHNIKAFVKHDGKHLESSYGLMQIQYSAAKTVGFTGKPHELMRPDINIEYAAKYLRWILDQTNDNYAKAVCGYNAGSNTPVCKHFGNTRYVALVFNAMIRQ
jgi:soluble lytic murein transglycosylase-like protein